jgi:16S rRNA (cytosine967-C5)-methyltransferase
MNRTHPSTAPAYPAAFALREAAAAVGAVIGGRTLDIALADCWASHPGLPASARGAVQDLAYAALRAYGCGDFALARLLRKRPAPALRALLLVALARLEARPEDAHVTVDQAVDAAAALAGARSKGLVNAVLRTALRRRAELESSAADDEVAHWRHPAWWLGRLRRDHPLQWQAIAAAGNLHPPMALRANACRIGRDAYAAELAAAGIEAVPRGDCGLLLARPLAVGRLPGFAAGRASVQDLGAQMAAPLLDVHDGMRVLDACAAPGGKSAHLLESARVDLTALDVDAGRMTRVAQNLERLGLQARLAVGDARRPQGWWDGRPYERILADVPCSASGVVRRHPDAKWLRRAGDVAGFAARQAQILDALWKLLAPDGKLLYATCSVFAEENVQCVAAFAARHPDCARLQSAGGADLQLLPDTEHDGFYYALLQKERA